MDEIIIALNLILKIKVNVKKKRWCDLFVIALPQIALGIMSQ